MSQVRVSAERIMEAPAPVVYRCIADYQRHHRPEGFLPPAFTSTRVEHGGVGAGTVIRFSSNIGRVRREMRQTVSEPQPGRVLVEIGDGASTTFTVRTEGQGCRVRIESVLEARGFAGFFMRCFAPGLLRPLYVDELRRLEQYAHALAIEERCLVTSDAA